MRIQEIKLMNLLIYWDENYYHAKAYAYSIRFVYSGSLQ